MTGPTTPALDQREAEAVEAIKLAYVALLIALDLCGKAGHFSWENVNQPLLEALQLVRTVKGHVS